MTGGNRLNKSSKPWMYNPALWFVLPALTLFLALGVYPTFQALLTSLFSYRLTNPDAKAFVGLSNYLHLFVDSRLWHALGRSLLFAAASVTLSFVIGFVVAMLLSTVRRFRTFFLVTLLCPMFIPPIVAAYTFKFMYNYHFGIINVLLEWLGLSRVNFLGNTATALWATVVIDIWQWTPLVILIMLAAIETLPKDVYDAAAVDGASRITMFFSLTLPLLRPFIVIVILLRLMDSMKAYEIIRLVTAGGPGTSSETLNTYLMMVSFNWFNVGYGSALGFFMLNLTALMSLMLLRYTNTFYTEVVTRR